MPYNHARIVTLRNDLEKRLWEQKEKLRTYLLMEPLQMPKSILKHKPLGRRNVVSNLRWEDSFRLTADAYLSCDGEFERVCAV